MLEIGLFRALLLVGIVTLAVWLINLLFPASGGSRKLSRHGADTFFVDQPCLAGRGHQDEDDTSCRELTSPG